MTDTPRTAEEILAALKALADQPSKKPLTPEEEVTLAQDLTGDLTMAMAKVIQGRIDADPGAQLPAKAVQTALINTMAIMFSYECFRRVQQSFAARGHTLLPAELLRVAYFTQMQADGVVMAEEVVRMMDFHGPRVFSQAIKAHTTKGF